MYSLGACVRQEDPFCAVWVIVAFFLGGVDSDLLLLDRAGSIVRLCSVVVGRTGESRMEYRTTSAASWWPMIVIFFVLNAEIYGINAIRPSNREKVRLHLILALWYTKLKQSRNHRPVSTSFQPRHWPIKFASPTICPAPAPTYRSSLSPSP